MTHKGPGKSDREGISLVKPMKMFPTGDAAREWFEARIWPHGPHCPHCRSANVQSGIKHRSMTHRCRVSPKHPGRYVDEFSGRHNVREDDTEDQTAHVAKRMVGRRLRYRYLAA